MKSKTFEEIMREGEIMDRKIAERKAKIKTFKKNVKKIAKMKAMIKAMGTETFELFQDVDEDNFSDGRDMRKFAETQGINIFDFMSK